MSIDASHPPTMPAEDVLRMRLGLLREEHRDLDTAIRAVEDAAAPDMLAIRRLKKKKLALKDEIARLEDRLTPDIIA
jgi:hypothetical protein